MEKETYYEARRKKAIGERQESKKHEQPIVQVNPKDSEKRPLYREEQ